MRKLFSKADIKVVTVNPNTHGSWIPPKEMTRVLDLVREVTYVLYSVYRTYPFKEADELEDATIGKLLNWSARKVRDHRRILEQENLYRAIRYGTKADGITRVFVGEEVIALFDAGLPASVLDAKALNKVKRDLGITCISDLVARVAEVEQYYRTNIEQFK